MLGIRGCGVCQTFSLTLVEPGAIQIINSENNDIYQIVKESSRATNLPMWYLIGTAIAESNLNPKAERWGAETTRAKQVLATKDWNTLRAVLRNAGADVSFGYGQQILLYHYYGDRTSSLENALAVREHVFNNPEENFLDMSKRLLSYFNRAKNDSNLWIVDNDPYLGGLLIYNSGSIRTDTQWWNQWARNVDNYRNSLNRAKQILGEQ